MLERMVHGATPLCLALLLGLFSGCARTRSIEALPPRPGVQNGSTNADLLQAGLARLEVKLEVPAQSMPEDAASVRFRVAGLRLRESGGMWHSYPAGAGVIRVDGRERLERTVLSTQISPAKYDSVEISFDDVYVEFDANAGGPITSEESPRAARLVEVEAEVGGEMIVILRLDPAASLIQDSSCRWHFLPFVSVVPD